MLNQIVSKVLARPGASHRGWQFLLEPRVSLMAEDAYRGRSDRVQALANPVCSPDRLAPRRRVEPMARRTMRRVASASIIPTAALVLALTPGLLAQRSVPQPEPDAATFNIFGLVVSPDSYTWSAGMTVKQAVALAGGYTSRGSKDDLQIQRLIDGKLASIVVTEDDPVLANDVIMVRARRY